MFRTVELCNKKQFFKINHLNVLRCKGNIKSITNQNHSYYGDRLIYENHVYSK